MPTLNSGWTSLFFEPAQFWILKNNLGNFSNYKKWYECSDIYFCLKNYKSRIFWDLVIYHSCVIRNNSQRLTCLTDGRKWIPDWIVERLSPQTRLSIPLLTYLHHVVLRDEVSGVSKGDSRIWEKWLSLETFRFGIPIILDEPGYFLSLPNFEICKKTWGI